MPILTDFGSASAICPITLGPSSSSTMATGYCPPAFSCSANSGGAPPALIRTNVWTFPLPLSCISSNSDEPWQYLHTPLGGQFTAPPFLHLYPIILYRWGIVLQYIGTETCAISSHLKIGRAS